MGLKHASQWLNRIVLIVAIAISALLMYFIQKVDQIINVQLYSYGLQASSAWLDPYHSLAMIIFTGLGAIIVLSGLSLVLGLRVNISESSSPAKPKQPLVQFQPVTSVAEEKDANKMYISCPRCKKEFSKPIVMLNFEGGKTKLVNVCPHCSHTLGNAGDEESDNSENSKNILQTYTH